MLESLNMPYNIELQETAVWSPPPWTQETRAHCHVTTTTMHTENTLTLLCNHQHVHTGNTFTLANMSMLFSIFNVAQSLDNTKMKAEIIWKYSKPPTNNIYFRPLCNKQQPVCCCCFYFQDISSKDWNREAHFRKLQPRKQRLLFYRRDWEWVFIPLSTPCPPTHKHTCYGWSLTD